MTTPAATTAVQEPRVSDGMLARLVFDAEAENWSPSSAWYWPAQLAFDLRDARATIASQAEALAAMKAENERLKVSMSKSNEEICQTLGKALGYPWFKDDQKNFPGSTEEHGVCVGEHVAESIVSEAARRLTTAEAALKAAREVVEAAGILEVAFGDDMGCAELDELRDALDAYRAALTPKEPTR